MLKSFQGDQVTDKSIVQQYYWLYVYRTIRLILISFALTYFFGCSWYYISKTMSDRFDEDDIDQSQMLRGGTWYKNFGIEDIDLWK
jgi:hypothetical protein